MGSLNYNFFRLSNIVPEIEIKVLESGTITEIRNIDFQFWDNEFTYLFNIYLFISIYLIIYFIYLFVYLFILDLNNNKPTIC